MHEIRPIILLTGAPRSGKTTMVARLADTFRRDIDGFITIEVRHEGRRIGFDVLDLVTHEFLPLARKEWHDAPYRVGSYGVRCDGLEIVIKRMTERRIIAPRLWIIDELGKMEAYSKRFLEWLNRTLTVPGVHALLTSGLRPHPAYHPLLERLHPDVIVLEPDRRESVEQFLRHRLAPLFIDH